MLYKNIISTQNAHPKYVLDTPSYFYIPRTKRLKYVKSTYAQRIKHESLILRRLFSSLSLPDSLPRPSLLRDPYSSLDSRIPTVSVAMPVRSLFLRRFDLERCENGLL